MLYFLGDMITFLILENSVLVLRQQNLWPIPNPDQLKMGLFQFKTKSTQSKP